MLIPEHKPPHDLKQLYSSVRNLIAFGERIKELFEFEIKCFLGTENYMTVSSGRRALYLALKSIDLSKGNEVIIPGFTTNIIPLIIREFDAIPVPVDVNIEDYNISIESILNALSDKTKAIIVVHTFGFPADVKAIQDICEDKGIYFIEDAAQAFGAKYKGKPVGTFGDIGIFSFGLGKSISLGGGGGIVINNEHLLKRITNEISREYKSSLTTFLKILGAVFLTNPYVYGILGQKIKSYSIKHQYDNYRVDIMDRMDISLFSYAIGLEQLRSNVIERRRKIAKMYTRVLRKYEHIYPPIEHPEIYSTYTRYFIRTESEELSNTIKTHLLRHNIEPVTLTDGYPISESLYPMKFKDNLNNSLKLPNILVGIPLSEYISPDLLRDIFEHALREVEV